MRIAFFASIIYLSLSALVCADSIYYVRNSGSNNNDGLSEQSAFATVQKAIAVSEGGDVISVLPGRYRENINFLGKAIIVQGFNGVPVIDGNDSYAVTFKSGEGGDSLLRNVIVTNSFCGIYISNSSPKIDRVTVVGNNDAIVANSNSDPIIENSIMWGNKNSDLVNCEARFCCVERGASGVANTRSNPLFADAELGDYHLLSKWGRWDTTQAMWVCDANSSPCIDRGDHYVDWGDELWPHGKRLNMGAYAGTVEASLSPLDYGHIADLDRNGRVDLFDFALISGQWGQGSGLSPENLSRDGSLDHADLVVLCSYWLEKEVPEGVMFRDYWPLDLGNHWWHANVVFDAGLDVKIVEDYEVNGIEVCDINYVYGTYWGVECEEEYMFYLDDKLYSTPNEQDVFALPEITGEMQLEFPARIRLNEPIYIPSIGPVMAFQGSLEEVLELSQTAERDSFRQTIDSFPSGNHANVLGFARYSALGTRLSEIYGYRFGPMYLSNFQMDGAVNTGPVVEIVEPVAGEFYDRGDIIDIKAEVAPYDSPIVKVEFLHWRRYSIGEDNDGTDGWSIHWTVSSNRHFELTARATTADGLTVSSRPLVINNRF